MKRGATCRVLTLSVLSESANLMATFVISFAFRMHQKDMASGAIVSATCDAMVPSLLSGSCAECSCFRCCL